MLSRLFLLAPLAGAAVIAPRQNTSQPCPGYRASNVHEGTSSLTADLALAGPACDTYGSDLEHLKLRVEYQTGACSGVTGLVPGWAPRCAELGLANECSQMNVSMW